MKVFVQIARVFCLCLAVAPAVAAESVYGMKFDCDALYGAGFRAATAPNAPDRAACLAGAGLLEEARALAMKGGDGKMQTILAADLLLPDSTGQRRANARNVAVEEAASGAAEAAMLLMIADAGSTRLELSPIQREGATTLLLKTPNWMLTRYARAFAESLLSVDDIRTTMWLGDAVSKRAEATNSLQLRPLAAFLKARATEHHGAAHPAADLYAEVKGPWNDALVVEAQLRRSALLWRVGAARTAETAAALQQLDLDWRGNTLGAQIALALARAQQFNGDPLAAARTLARVIKNAPSEALREEARYRLESAVQAAIDTQTDVAQFLVVFSEVRPLIKDSAEYWPGDVDAALALARGGLPTAAARLLNSYDADTVLAAGGATDATKFAEAWVEIGNRTRANKFLTASRKSGPTDKPLSPTLLINAAAPADFAALEKAATTKEAAALLADRAWSAGDWAVYANLNEGSPRRRLLAAYLGAGTRPAPVAATDKPDELTVAFAQAATQPRESAKDLRADLAGADAVLTLRPYLPRNDGSSTLSLQNGPSQ